MRNALVVALMVAPASAGAAYVTPQLGGGSPGVTASMKHADVTFANNQLSVHLDESVPTPRLRPLVEGDAFDPAAPWAPLNGRGYNAQYGWNAGGFISLPSGSAIWVEALDASPGLEVYQAPVDANGYAPLFGTDGSAERWKWSGRMSHNYYAATTFAREAHWATYRVYLGEAASGDPLAGYGAAEVTFEFALPGDYDNDGRVDPTDLGIWKSQHAATGVDRSADGTGDGVVDAADYVVWRDARERFGGENDPAAVPEPAAMLLVLAGLLAAGRR